MDRCNMMSDWVYLEDGGAGPDEYSIIPVAKSLEWDVRCMYALTPVRSYRATRFPIDGEIGSIGPWRFVVSGAPDAITDMREVRHLMSKES